MTIPGPYAQIADPYLKLTDYGVLGIALLATGSAVVILFWLLIKRYEQHKEEILAVNREAITAINSNTRAQEAIVQAQLSGNKGQDQIAETLRKVDEILRDIHRGKA